MTDSPSWRTSSFSGAQGGNCVEVGQAAGTIMVRDTTDYGNGPVHRFTAAQWRAFAAAVRDGAPGPGRARAVTRARPARGALWCLAVDERIVVAGISGDP